MLIRRQVFMDVLQAHRLPICDERSRRFMIPFFQPVVGPHEDEYRWLDSDFGFCELARRCGHRVMADTTVRVWWVGSYGYSWEEAGNAPQRYATFFLSLG